MNKWLLLMFLLILMLILIILSIVLKIDFSPLGKTVVDRYFESGMNA